MSDYKPHDAAREQPGYAEPSYSRLALHHWRMGQVLQPAQMQAQEQALLQHIGLRSQIAGLPSYGVARLQWNDEQLRAGEIFIKRLTVVFPSGLLIDVPGNATMTNRSLSLPGDEIGQVSLYVHVRYQTRNAAGMSQYTGEDGDDPGVVRVIHQLELSLVPNLDHAREPLKLAELAFDGDRWSLGAYAPPLLGVGVGVTPFLNELIEQALGMIRAFEAELVRRAGNTLAGTEQMTELRRLLSCTYRLQAFLADHGLGAPTRSVALHPYYMFCALREFYLDATVFQGKAIESWPIRYQHDNVAACFEELVSGLTTSLQVQIQVSPRLRFEHDGYWFITGFFPDELRQASDVYLLIEPGDTGEEHLGDLKLASPRRSEEVYTKQLTGVPREPIPSLTFSQTFGHRAIFFQLDSTSEEWQHARHEGALCFAALPQFKGIGAALFWRRTES